uniref:BZIP domain-containing protein n=1 Tax=Macrostomum lignano TaxID=282301 RepID=A0A1I8H599_9PLAT
MHSLKCSMTLPLQPSQPQQQSASAATPDLLASLGFLSPTGGLSMAASTAELLLTPTSFLNPSFVTEEQRDFVTNFDEKLQHLMSSEVMLPTAGADQELEEPAETDDADEDWMADSSDKQLQLSSMATQASCSTGAGTSRLERKRRRNRDAARRCRERKLERLRCLDERAGELRKRNGELGRLAARLRTELDALRRQGCHCSGWTGLLQ